MLISDADPKLHQWIRGWGESERNKVCNRKNLRRLFPLNLKPSDDSDKRITDIFDFETDVIFLLHFTLDHLVELEKRENLCSYIQDASIWNIRMFNFFQKKLQEKSDIPLTLDESPKLQNAYTHITRHLIEAQILNVDAFNEKMLEVLDINREIDIGKNVYLKTKTSVDALPLLEGILENEKKHNSDRESAQKTKTTLDPSVSQDYIRRQIQLIESMPVEALQDEVEEVSAQICPIAKHLKLCREAEKYIFDTWESLIRAIYQTSNGDDETLDLLVQKVDSFKKEWEIKYAHEFKFSDCSKAKRQRTA